MYNTYDSWAAGEQSCSSGSSNSSGSSGFVGTSMTTSTTTPSRTTMSLDEARSRIAADHALLRGLADALVGASRAALHDEKQRFSVRALLAQLCSEIDRHVVRENEVVPILLSHAALPRAAQFAKDHSDQRTVLVALSDDAEDGVCTSEELLDEIVWFAERFERDMSEEEALFGCVSERASGSDLGR